MTVTSSGHLYERIRAAWNHEAAGYDQRPGHGIMSAAERRAWTEAVARTLAGVSGSTTLRIADVGAGTGAMSLLLAGMGHQVTAIDLAPAMLDQARANAARQGVSLSCLEGNAAALPLGDATMDVVFSRHLFWTLPEPVPTVREWARVVRPGGLVVIADGWWNEPSAAMRRRRLAGAALRRIVRQHDHDHADYAALHLELPVADGVSPYGIRYFLDQAGLVRLGVRDLKAVRQAERRSLPLWHWIDRARFTWLASGVRP
jgi:ubiquinone/menaquinone biosynthesis C-methylase UbiE